MAETRELLTPVFHVMTGLSLALFILVMVLVREQWRGAGGTMLKFAMLVPTLGFFLVSEAGKEYSLGGATVLLIAAGASFFVTLILTGAGLVLLGRNGPVGG